MQYFRYRVSSLTSCFLLLFAQQVLAGVPIQQHEHIRIELSQNDSMEAIMTESTLFPGAKIPLYTNPGDVLIYVLQGGMLEKEDGETVELITGTSQYMSHDQILGGMTVIGNLSIKLLIIHIVEKNSPVLIPVDNE